MAFKIAVVSAFTVFIQGISSQCVGNIGMAANGMGWSGNDMNWAGSGMSSADHGMAASYFPANNEFIGCGKGNAFQGIDTHGGSLRVTSFSPIAPSGLRVISEQTLNGDLSVVGKLPFLGAVSLDGVLPAAGEAQVTYGCGDGNVRIIESFGSNHDTGANKLAYNTAAGIANELPHAYETANAFAPRASNMQSLGAGMNYGTGAMSSAGINRAGCAAY